MPISYDNSLHFKNYNYFLKVPFVVYADFESTLEKIDTCQPSTESSYTNPYQKIHQLTLHTILNIVTKICNHQKATLELIQLKCSTKN